MRPANITEWLAKSVIMRMKYRDHELKRLQEFRKSHTCIECEYVFGDDEERGKCTKCGDVFCKDCRFHTDINWDDDTDTCSGCTNPVKCGKCVKILTNSDTQMLRGCKCANDCCIKCSVIRWTYRIPYRWCSWECSIRRHDPEACIKCKNTYPPGSKESMYNYCSICDDITYMMLAGKKY